MAASGDRLLISLLVNAKEKKSFFGFGGEANVHIWGRPVLDQAQQTLRLTNIELAVESEAAFGLLGAAARAAMPHLQRALADKATIDLKPFASNAQKKIAAVIADFQKNEDGVRVSAEITSLRLAEIAFDSKTLRVIAEADGTMNVYLIGAAGAVMRPGRRLVQFSGDLPQLLSEVPILWPSTASWPPDLEISGPARACSAARDGSGWSGAPAACAAGIEPMRFRTIYACVPPGIVQNPDQAES